MTSCVKRMKLREGHKANFVMKNVFDKIKIVLTTLDVDMPKSFGFVLTSIIHCIWNFRIDT